MAGSGNRFSGEGVELWQGRQADRKCGDGRLADQSGIQRRLFRPVRECMAEFRFVTTWRIEAPVDEVCAAICDCLLWPVWWRGVEQVEELEAGGDDGIGSRRRFTWRGRLPYRLTFDMRVTRFVAQTLLEGAASGSHINTSPRPRDKGESRMPTSAR